MLPVNSSALEHVPPVLPVALLDLTLHDQWLGRRKEKEGIWGICGILEELLQQQLTQIQNQFEFQWLPIVRPISSCHFEDFKFFSLS